MRILVTGAGGFIGGHLVKELLRQGHEVRAVDIKAVQDWWQEHEGAENLGGIDLRSKGACVITTRNIQQVYNLAADMGGIGFIEHHRADCMISSLINTHLLQAARDAGVKRYLFASSACVYGEGTDTREETAWPATPEEGYGLEKLFSEKMCQFFTEDYGLETRVARLHNVYGPHGTWRGGREKAPAAICRKVAEATDSIEIWGDGTQTRSFMHVNDAVEGLIRIMEGKSSAPVNLGSSEMVSVERLVELVERIAGKKLERTYDLNAPRGVKGRNSDNTLILQRYGWEPSIPLREGLKDTYEWVAEQVRAGVAT